MTDPGRPHITDQPHADDAAQGHQEGARRPRTYAQWLDYFNERYGDSYTVCAPSAPGGQWRATAIYGQKDQLFGWSATDLLDELIEHRSQHHAMPQGRT